MTEERQVFEHFSHDACILPMDSLPYWKNRFQRQAKKLYSNDTGDHLLGRSDRLALIRRIKKEGPLSSKDFQVSDSSKPRATWSKPPHKNTLDYLWLKGELAVSKRVNFFKHYDISDRVYSQSAIKEAIGEPETIEWLSVNALQRLGFGTIGEIKRFWEACTLPEVKQWVNNNAHCLNTLTVESVHGKTINSVSHKSQQALLRNPPKPTTRLRIINPFDPIVRDRKRLSQLFGFEYRIEIYTPPDKRVYGYYVYPLLEFDKFVGRIEVRHDKVTNTLFVDNLWPEKKVEFGKSRMHKLNAELERVRRFVKADRVGWSK